MYWIANSGFIHNKIFNISIMFTLLIQSDKSNKFKTLKTFNKMYPNKLLMRPIVSVDVNN